MEAREERDRGLVLVAAGLAVVVLAVLLFGLTTTSGALDWVSIITAIAGLMLAVAGMYLIFHDKGGSTHTGPHPHTGS